MVIDPLDLRPYNTDEIKEFFSVWTPCSIDEMGILKEHLNQILRGVFEKYKGQKNTPELINQLQAEITTTCRQFEKIFMDFRFVDISFVGSTGDLGVNLKIQSRGLQLKTIRNFDPLLYPGLNFRKPNTTTLKRFGPKFGQSKFERAESILRELSRSEILEREAKEAYEYNS